MTNFSRSVVRRAASLLLAGSAGLVSVSSWAATDTANLAVTATIANQCSVGAAALALGAITMVGTDGTMAALSGGTTADIPWACTNGTSATLGFNLGANTSGTDRRMLSTTAGSSNQFFEYQLKAGTSSGAAITETAVALSGADGTNKSFTVWGGPVDSAANRAAKPAADYTDTVLLTVTFTP
ncbi:MAG: Spore Coat Protein domain [Ramlibacter sp.]|nr:Spore Coat Protein domain [Ramlibacter sp.]